MNQFSIIVSDLDKTIKTWTEYMNVGPWRIIEFSDEHCKHFEYRGELVTEPFKFLCAITHVNGIELEVIQPCYGPNVYSDFLEKHGNCPQHVKFAFSDNDALDKAVEEFKAIGIMPIQMGDLYGNRHYYIDTVDKLDCLIELGSKTLSSYPADKIRWYPEKQSN